MGQTKRLSTIFFEKEHRNHDLRPKARLTRLDDSLKKSGPLKRKGKTTQAAHDVLVLKAACAAACVLWGDDSASRSGCARGVRRRRHASRGAVSP